MDVFECYFHEFKLSRHWVYIFKKLHRNNMAHSVLGQFYKSDVATIDKPYGENTNIKF